MISKLKLKETSTGTWYILAKEEYYGLPEENFFRGVWYKPVFRGKNGVEEVYGKYPTLYHAKDFIVDNFPMV